MTQRLASDSIISKTTYGGGNKKTHITIHETGNTRAGANAEMHARLQAGGNSRQASWHYQVDDKEAIQSFLHDISCWHGGDGSKGLGNLDSIAIEICVNSDGDFKKAVENAAALTRHIMKQENIPIQNVVQHNLWSGKNCPTYLRDGSKGINWTQFLDTVKQPAETKTASVPKPKEEVKLFNTGSAALNKEFLEALKLAKNQGFFAKDTPYIAKMEAGTLTEPEAIALTMIVAKRAFLDKN